MILITGSSGLVGSHLIFSLLNAEKKVENQKIKALIRNKQSIEKIRKVFQYYCKNSQDLLSQISWYIGDIRDYSSLEEAFGDVDYVYHCAATISFNKKDRQLMSEVNIQGTANIVNICLDKGVKKLVHVSSIAAIAKPIEGDLYTEEGLFPQGKISAYSYTKTQSELKIWQGMAEGLNAIIINPSIILGPGSWNAGSGRLFLKVKNGMKFFTKGIAGFVDVRDVVEAMIALMTSNISTERFIINAENLSYETVFKLIAKALRVKPPKYYASPFLTSMVWRIDYILSLLTFKKPTLTKQTAKASHNIQKYSSAKLIKLLNFKFTSINKAIKHTASCLLKE